MMKQLLLLALFCGPLPVMAQDSAAPTTPTLEAFQAAGDKLFSKLEEFAKVLDTARNKATAEAAKPKLAKLNKEIEVLGKAALAMGTPPPEIKAALENDVKMQERAQGFMDILIKASRRIADDKDMLAILQSTMKDFQKVSQPPRPAEPATPGK